jgi:hypothetical protein
LRFCLNRLILLTVLFSCVVVNAQNFFPFDQGALFQLKKRATHDMNGIYYYNDYYYQFTVTNTVIGLYNYFTLFDIPQNYYRYDSTAKKLFILINDEEKLAADMSRPQGSFDTLYIDGTPRYYQNSGIYYYNSEKARFEIKSIEFSSPNEKKINEFWFVEGIGVFYRISQTTTGAGYVRTEHQLLSAIAGQDTSYPILLTLSTPVIPPIYSNNPYYTLSVTINYDYLPLLGNLTLQVKLFSADSVVYSTVFSGDKATGEFNIFLPSLYMAVSDSIGFRFNCTDISIFNNSVYLPQEGFLVVPVNKVLSAEESNSDVRDFRLFQNTPNPFNPSTTITWHQPSGNYTTLKLYDLLGKEVSKLVDSYYEAGIHQIQFNAGSLSSGTYFYTFRSGQYYQTRKMILTK